MIILLSLVNQGQSMSTWALVQLSAIASFCLAFAVSLAHCLDPLPCHFSLRKYKKTMLRWWCKTWKDKQDKLGKMLKFVEYNISQIPYILLSFVQDTNHLLKVIAHLVWIANGSPPQTLDLIMMDVNSLYPNIPCDQGIRAVRNFLAGSFHTKCPRWLAA